MNRYFHKVMLFGSICVFREFYQTISDPIRLVITDKKGQANDRLYDFETGRAAAFDLANTASLLLRDEVLYIEFDALPARERKKKLYKYVEKYNERNPVFAVN
jgi:hypothetical protein